MIHLSNWVWWVSFFVLEFGRSIHVTIQRKAERSDTQCGCARPIVLVLEMTACYPARFLARGSLMVIYLLGYSDAASGTSTPLPWGASGINRIKSDAEA